MDALVYVAETTGAAIADFYLDYSAAFTKISEERGWPPVTRRQFDALRSARGALLVGNPEEVAVKLRAHIDALGGISRIKFQMSVASLPHEKLVSAIELLGTRVASLVHGVEAR